MVGGVCIQYCKAGREGFIEEVTAELGLEGCTELVRVLKVEAAEETQCLEAWR